MMKSAKDLTIVAMLLTSTLLASCAATAGEDEPSADAPAIHAPAVDVPAIDAPLPALTVCEVPDPKDPGSGFAIERGTAEDLASRWVNYACRHPCRPGGAPTQHDRWQECTIEALGRRGKPLLNGRGGNKRQLAFVVDGMGGDLAFTADGDKTVFFHHGGGGARFPQNSANLLEKDSTARTVMMRWAPGYGDFVFPLGWFTRNSPEPRDVRHQSRRVAAVLQWVHDHLSQGQAFGTVADSMGTVATFGAVAWHDLDSIIDYQLLVGGPPMWDVNAACGRVRYPQGYCDLDATTACRQDADCQSKGQGRCRKPAPLPTNAAIWEGIINYVYVSDACHPLPEGAADDPHPPFQSSSLRHTGIDWQIDHPVDFMIDLGSRPGPRSRGGDEYWALGQFTFIYNRIDAATSWTVSHGTDHSQAMDTDDAVAKIKKGLGL